MYDAYLGGVSLRIETMHSRRHRNKWFAPLIGVLILLILVPGGDTRAHYPAPPDTVLPAYAPNRLIVKVKPEAVSWSAKSAGFDLADLESKADALGSPRISPLVAPASLAHTNLSAAGPTLHPAAQVFVFDFVDRVDLDSLKTRTESMSWVEYAEFDHLMQLFEIPDDPLLVWQWGLENTGQTIPVVDRIPGDSNDTIAWVDCNPGFDVDFHTMYDHPGPQSPVIVGVLDTGSDTRHEDLTGNLWHNPGEIPGNGIDDDHNGYVDDYFGYDFSGDETNLPNELIPDSDPTDSVGHGTHVAGTVAATTNNALGVAGLANHAQIMTLKIFPNAFNSVVARAVYYGVDNGAEIFNMSFGGPFPSKTISDALVYARSRGILSIAASGNSGTEIRNYPAADTAVLSVGALDYLGNVAVFSTFGDHLNMVAPGVSILSLRAAGTDLYAGGGEPNIHIIAEKYLLADGTSMATPHVAGCAAALSSIEAGLTPERLAEIMISSCVDIVDPLGTGELYPGWDKYSGHGLINLGQAINELAGVTLKITSPHEADVLWNKITVEGTAAGPAFSGYQLDYGPGKSPVSWVNLTSATDPVINGTIHTWQTTGLTGVYTLRLRAEPSHEDRVTITLANSTSSHITSPQNGDTIALVEVVYGSTIAPDYVSSEVSFFPESSPESTITVWTGTAPIVDDSICAWTVDAEIEGWYYLKLITQTNRGMFFDSVLAYIKNPFHAGWPAYIPAHAFYAPAVANLDGEEGMEFIVPTSRGLYVFKEDGSVAPGWPRDTLINFQSIPAIADLDPDTLLGENPTLEIVIASENYIHVYAFNGEQYYLWPREFSGYANLYGVAVPLVCDLDGEYFLDGSPEILVIDYGGIIHAFNEDGSEYDKWHPYNPLVVDAINTYFASIPRAVVVDAAEPVGQEPQEPQGQNELIVAADGIWIWNALTGRPFETGQDPQIRDFHATYGMAVGNFDFDRQLEIAVIYLPLGSHIWHVDVLKANGTSLPGWPVSTEISDEVYLMHSLAAGDVDGDGLPEIFLTAYFVGRGFVLAYHADGTPLLPENSKGQFLEFAGSSSGVSLADVTGDGQPEIVLKVGDFFFGDEYLYALTPDGELIPGYPLRFGFGIGTQLAAPLTTDLDGDGFLNMLTLESSGQVATAWDFPFEFKKSGRPWPKFRRDNWNSGVVPAPPHYNPVYIVKFINYMFRYQPWYFLPYDSPEHIVDANCDGRIDLLDLVTVINHVYRNGPEPCLP